MDNKKPKTKEEIKQEHERKIAHEAVLRLYSKLTDEEKENIDKRKYFQGYTPEEAEERIQDIKNGEYDILYADGDNGPMILTDEKLISHIRRNTH